MKKVIKLSGIVFLSFVLTNFLLLGKIFGEWAFYLSFFGPSIITVFILSIFLQRETIIWVGYMLFSLSAAVGIYLGLLFKVSLKVGFPFTRLLFSIQPLGEQVTEELFAINYYFLPSQLVIFIVLLLFYKFVKQ